MSSNQMHTSGLFSIGKENEARTTSTEIAPGGVNLSRIQASPYRSTAQVARPTHRSRPKSRADSPDSIITDASCFHQRHHLQGAQLVIHHPILSIFLLILRFQITIANRSIPPRVSIHCFQCITSPAKNLNATVFMAQDSLPAHNCRLPRLPIQMPSTLRLLQMISPCAYHNVNHPPVNLNTPQRRLHQQRTLRLPPEPKPITECRFPYFQPQKHRITQGCHTITPCLRRRLRRPSLSPGRVIWGCHLHRHLPSRGSTSRLMRVRLGRRRECRGRRHRVPIGGVIA